MNQLVKLIFFALPLSSLVAHASERRVQDFALDDHTVYTIPVSGARVTTISFPSPIAAVDGPFTTTAGKTPGRFRIPPHTGTAYFSPPAPSKDRH